MRLPLKSILVSAWDLESTQEMVTLWERKQGATQGPWAGPTSGLLKLHLKVCISVVFFWSEDIIDFFFKVIIKLYIFIYFWLC